MDRGTLEGLDRDTLVSRAETAGVVRARVLTRPELIDEILRRDPQKSPEETRRARGFLGLARDLLARVVERGLHLPDAADRIRGIAAPPLVPRAAVALPTVTLAEIYATQGHKGKAIETLEQVLVAEPEHGAARALLSKLEAAEAGKDEPVLPPEPEEAMESSYMEEGGTDASEIEPATMLDAEPLPDRYDTDECIAMGVDPTTLYVYWEIKEDTFEHLRTRMPGGRIALRVLVVTPNWDGPRARSRDIEVHAAVGDWFVREMPEGAVIRAAVGWLSTDGVFVSAAHSRGVEPSRDERSPALAHWLARWTPEASYAVPSSEPEADKLARAVARIEARRAAQAAGAEAGYEEKRAGGPFGAPRLGGSSELSARPTTSSWS